MKLRRTITSKDRAGLVQLCTLTIANKALINYSEDNRTGYLSKAALEATFKAGKSVVWDCAHDVSELFYAQGLGDPNGQDFTQLGYTGYMLDTLPDYTNVADGKPGALLVFGAYPGVHVCMIMHPDGDNPWLQSNGSQAGPLYIRLADERLAHEGQEVTMLDVSHLTGLKA